MNTWPCIWCGKPEAEHGPPGESEYAQTCGMDSWRLCPGTTSSFYQPLKSHRKSQEETPTWILEYLAAMQCMVAERQELARRQAAEIDALRQKEIVTCRNTKGPCFCGAHSSTAMGASDVHANK